MNFPNFTQILIESLSYPGLAKLDFLFHEQDKSGWSKEAFQEALSREYDNFLDDISLIMDEVRKRMKAEEERIKEEPWPDEDDFDFSDSQSRGEAIIFFTMQIQDELRIAIDELYKRNHLKSHTVLMKY